MRDVTKCLKDETECMRGTGLADLKKLRPQPAGGKPIGSKGTHAEAPWRDTALSSKL